MKFLTAVPIYNEERYLRKVIPFLFAAKLPIEAEWIFIDDKSTDQSLKIIEELSNHKVQVDNWSNFMLFSGIFYFCVKVILFLLGIAVRARHRML